MLTDHLVLAGGGHTHALVLLRWAMNPHLRPKGMITLVNRHSTNIYSSMFPGVIAGKYKLQDIVIDLRHLSRLAGISFLTAEVSGLNLEKNFLELDQRPPLEFSYLSIDIGSETFLNREHLQLLEQNIACSIKPFNKSIQWIQDLENQTKKIKEESLTIVGSGLSAIEISLALRERWPARKLNLQIYEEKLNATFLGALIKARINLIAKKQKIKGPTLLCTGSSFPKWLKESGLPINNNGRVITSNTLQVLDYPNIFAAGDCSFIKDSFRPASGVWAVKAAKPLAKNIERSFKSKKLINWKPQNNALQLIGINYKQKLSTAIAKWGPIIIGPSRLLWEFKEKIDRKFIEKFNLRQKMKAKNERNLCRGCGAKIAASTLKHALTKSGYLTLSNNPEDATFICSTSNQETCMQSLDGFPALISDPWLNARITTLHACSDIWAVGAVVKSAQALIVLPEVSSRLQEELLRQCLEGIKSALGPQGALLIGGHTYESRSPLIKPIGYGIEISLCVNGILQSTQSRYEKGGLQPGDKLLISRGIGSGVAFAAAMEGQVNSEVLDAVLCELSKSQHTRLDFLSTNQINNKLLINACTDITGFGLLGHLGEMISLSNSKRSIISKKNLKIKLFGEKIPSFLGVKNLIKEGYRSTLAPSNSMAWSLLETNGNEEPIVDLVFEDKKNDFKEIQSIRDLIIDPQTCGPLLISCPSNTANYLVDNCSWISIGSVEEVI